MHEHVSGCLYIGVKNKLAMIFLTLTYHSFWKLFILNKATAMSYSGLKHFIKETGIWTLKYHFQLQEKWTEII